MSEQKLPLKVVPQIKRDFYRPDPGGGPKKIFGEVTPEIRQALTKKTEEVLNHFKEKFVKNPGIPGVMGIKLKPQAIAKSHRPTHLFNNKTCPIIGNKGSAEILVSATSKGLANLAKVLELDESKSGIAAISTIQNISPVDPIIEIDEAGDTERPLKVRLFNHDDTLDNIIEKSFFELMGKLGKQEKIKKINYGGKLKIFSVPNHGVSTKNALLDFLGTQSVESFPMYFPVRSSATKIRSLTSNDFPPPEPNVDYPIVGVVDSGTNASDKKLAAWVVGREELVPPSEQNNVHGSFVAALVAQPRILNHDDSLFPSCNSKILDIVALNAFTGTREDELLAILEDVIPRYSSVKFWNLSLGTTNPIKERNFSDFAVALDRLQHQHGITFVLSAGNYITLPLRGWPPENLNEQDRICAPADSVRSIVVGSIAHRDHSTSRVKTNEPSPFSRKGPGPLYLVKPEISHVGGNCNQKLDCSQIGILSLDGNGNLAEDIGTSFSTPLISTLAANIENRLSGNFSKLLTRALLVHSAAMSNGKSEPNLLHYKGFGVPPDIKSILGCEPWQCTLVFELDIPPGVAYEKAVFPMPQCLHINEDTVKADILITLVCEPELEASYGAEYCRTNIEVSLGTYDLNKKGKRMQKKQVPEDPKLGGAAYEKDLIKNGFKWSPVKVYRREMIRGVKGEQWRLDLSVQHRSAHNPKEKQKAVVLLSISDPDKKAPVYNEMVVSMNRLGWGIHDLQLATRITNR